jgi:hypothetical protein
MFFYPDNTVNAKEVTNNINEFLSGYKNLINITIPVDSLLTIQDAIKLMERFYHIINNSYKRYSPIIGEVFRTGDFNKIWANLGLKDYIPERDIKKFELAVLFEGLLSPFDLYVEITNDKK